MSRPMALVARLLGAIGLAGGVYLVLATWAVTLPAYAVARVVVPQLFFSEPLIWFGLALLLSPTLAHLVAQAAEDGAMQGEDRCAAAAYVHCPECELLVRVGHDHCPYCGEPLKGPGARPERVEATRAIG